MFASCFDNGFDLLF